MLEHITPSRARELLARYKLKPRQTLGQNFLVDPNTARKIVRIAGVQRTDTVLEIGAGLGSLTVALAEAGGHVVAVEIDRHVARALTEVVKRALHVEVVVADALESDLASLAGLRALAGARLVANLPYNVATPIMAKVLDDAPELRSGVVMVQRELGERWTAKPGSKAYGAISVKFEYYAEAKIAGDIKRTVFLPQPKVDSVLVSFRRREPPVSLEDPKGFLTFVSRVFGHRRKNLRNALLAGGVAKDVVPVALERAGIDPGSRAEQTGIDAFARLYAELVPLVA